MKRWLTVVIACYASAVLAGGGVIVRKNPAAYLPSAAVSDIPDYDYMIAYWLFDTNDITQDGSADGTHTLVNPGGGASPALAYLDGAHCTYHAAGDYWNAGDSMQFYVGTNQNFACTFKIWFPPGHPVNAVRYLGAEDGNSVAKEWWYREASKDIHFYAPDEAALANGADAPTGSWMTVCYTIHRQADKQYLFTDAAVRVEQGMDGVGFESEFGLTNTLYYLGSTERGITFSVSMTGYLCDVGIWRYPAGSAEWFDHEDVTNFHNLGFNPQ